MRICIYGAGAIGGMLGFLLKRIGVDVTLIARREHYASIKKNGLTFISTEYNIEESLRFDIFDNLENLGKFDLVINSLKAHSANQTASIVSTILHENSIMLPTLNGVPWWFFHKFGGKFDNYKLKSVDPNQSLWKNVTPSKVLGCVVYPAAIIERPGVIKHIEGKRFIIGEPDNAKSERVSTVSDLLIKAGLKAPISRDIRSDIWLKLIGNSSFNPLSVITQNTLKEICENEDTKIIIENMMNEAISIGEKLNIKMKLTIEKRIEGARNVGNHKTSTLQDYKNKRPLELNALIKSLIELGELTEVKTPTLNTIYRLAKFFSEKKGCPAG
ncbi:MAG: 2-dehydropantoate 2-reductase [Pelagibacterales bacterium]|nr:2-dehydropantoate 2-reductase [Pelagibacterales bacterium]